MGSNISRLKEVDTWFLSDAGFNANFRHKVSHLRPSYYNVLPSGLIWNWLFLDHGNMQHDVKLIHFYYSHWQSMGHFPRR